VVLTPRRSVVRPILLRLRLQEADEEPHLGLRHGSRLDPLR